MNDELRFDSVVFLCLCCFHQQHNITKLKNPILNCLVVANNDPQKTKLSFGCLGFFDGFHPEPRPPDNFVILSPTGANFI